MGFPDCRTCFARLPGRLFPPLQVHYGSRLFAESSSEAPGLSGIPSPAFCRRFRHKGDWFSAVAGWRNGGRSGACGLCLELPAVVSPMREEPLPSAVDRGPYRLLPALQREHRLRTVLPWRRSGPDLALCHLDGTGGFGPLLLPWFAAEVTVRVNGAFRFRGSAPVDRSAAQGRYQDPGICECRKAQLESVLPQV